MPGAFRTVARNLRSQAGNLSRSIDERSSLIDERESSIDFLRLRVENLVRSVAAAFR
jgi:hypothetical protein